MAYTTSVALKNKLLHKVILSTDSEEILTIGKSLGVEAPFLRPSELAQDNTPTIDVVIHLLNYLKNQGDVYDAVCLLQPTCPFREEKALEEALLLFQNNNTDSLISVLPVPHEYNPHWTFVDKENNHRLSIATGEKEIIKRRQELPEAFHRDGSIYITKTNVILEQHSLYGESISYIVSSKQKHVNIDTLEDWEKAEQILRQHNIA